MHPGNGSPASHLDTVKEESLGHLIHYIGGQDSNENAGRQGKNVPAVVSNVQVLRDSAGVAAACESYEKMQMIGKAARGKEITAQQKLRKSMMSMIYE